MAKAPTPISTPKAGPVPDTIVEIALADDVTVQTTGDFMLVDPFNGNEITREASTVTATSFILDRLASGQLVEA